MFYTSFCRTRKVRMRSQAHQPLMARRAIEEPDGKDMDDDDDLNLDE
jgi:hypothetical protein